MVNNKLKYNFVETPRKFTIELSGVSTKLHFNYITCMKFDMMVRNNFVKNYFIQL